MLNNDYFIFKYFFQHQNQGSIFVFLPFGKKEVGKDCGIGFFYGTVENILLFHYIYWPEEVKHSDHRNTLWS